MCDSNSALSSLLDILDVFIENGPAGPPVPLDWGKTQSNSLREPDRTSLAQLKKVKTNIW